MQVLIALRFYATGAFQRVTGDLFGVSVLATCTVIHKVSRAIAKQKGQFLSIPENLADSKRKFYHAAHFSHFSFFFSFHFTFHFHDDQSHALFSTGVSATFTYHP